MLRTGGGFQLGKIFGIPIILDFSFFISLALITFILSDIFADRIEPEPSDATAWGLAAAGAVIFFVTLLLHELAHSVTARLYGMSVASITLFLLGGVSQITEDSKRPSQEFLIAVVGPLTSALLGLLFFGLFLALGAGTTPLATLLGYLGFINFLLAAFNMIPGFPLDGGRVFRAGLWALTGSRLRATRWAARVGQGVGALMAGYGLLTLLNFDLGFASDRFGGIWAILIGAFLFNAAAQSLRSVQAEERLASIRVRDVMSTQLRSVDAETQVRWLAPQRDRLDARAAFLVTRDETVVGLVSGAALVLLDEQRYATVRMSDVMVPADAISPIGPGASGQEALQRLQRERIAVLPVVENGKLLGLIGLDQVMQALSKAGSAPAAG